MRKVLHQPNGQILRPNLLPARLDLLSKLWGIHLHSPRINMLVSSWRNRLWHDLLRFGRGMLWDDLLSLGISMFQWLLPHVPSGPSSLRHNMLWCGSNMPEWDVHVYSLSTQ
jgi:hypothetical protein